MSSRYRYAAGAWPLAFLGWSGRDLDDRGGWVDGWHRRWGGPVEGADRYARNVSRGSGGGGGAVMGLVTRSLAVGWFLAVARVRSWSHRAWIWRWTAAGLNEACWAARRRLGSGLTSGWALVRACGVCAGSYFLLIFAPSRILEISFCCG